jgi:hypothetical protein
MGFYMEIFEARVLGENLYLHQRFTQCSKWSTSCIIKISKPIYHIPYTVQRKKYNPNFSFFLKEIKELPSA